jgi:prepilin-type N-terminal cleavage/methylation domain-containing protein
MKRKKIYLNHSAFTMLELVFVIVVLGILAALAIPRLDRDLRQEAADNILSAIRYTQHLALLDNRHDFNNQLWQKSFWTIRFQADGSFYTVSSNIDYDTNVDKNETAIDPANRKLMYSNDNVIDSDESPNIFLLRKYGINSVDFSACTNTANGQNLSTHIAFDYQGRPHKGVYNTAANDYRTVMRSNCSIRFKFIDTSINDIVIRIMQETGYAFIVGQPDS